MKRLRKATLIVDAQPVGEFGIQMALGSWFGAGLDRPGGLFAVLGVTSYPTRRCHAPLGETVHVRKHDARLEKKKKVGAKSLPVPVPALLWECIIRCVSGAGLLCVCSSRRVSVHIAVPS